MWNGSVPLDFARVANLTSEKVLPDLKAANPDTTVLNYLFGSLPEIGNVLKEWSKDEQRMHEKLPMIALLEPFKIRNGGEYRVLIANVLIAAVCRDTTWRSYDREVNSVRPVLMPIYNAMLTYGLRRCGMFVANDPKRIPHDLTPMKHYGGGPYESLAAYLNEPVDALLIERMELKLSADYTF